MLEILRVLRLLWAVRLTIVHEATDVESFLAFARHDAGQLHLLMLQDVHEDHASHVGVVGSLVVVREEGLSLVVAALVLGVEAPAQVAFELVVIGALLVHLA